MTTLRQKLERLRGDRSEWIGGFPPPRINEDEWNALIDVALAAIDECDTTSHHGPSDALYAAIAGLERVMG